MRATYRTATVWTGHPATIHHWKVLRCHSRNQVSAVTASGGHDNHGQRRQQQQQQPPPVQQQPVGGPKGGRGLLASVLSLSAAPYSSYVPEPKTFLHHASAEAKQLWIVAVLLITASAPAAVRLAAVALLLTATIAALPRRLWGPQLRRLAGFCALLFVFTAIGSDGVPPVLVQRSVPASLPAAMAAGGTAAAGAAAVASSALQQLPATMAGLAPAYKYTLFKLGPITVTRKGLNLAVSMAALTFTALQSASLCLVTTPPERMAAAIGKALSPLGWLGLPVKELVLTVLLALRFMGTVFEECRNLCLGLASRGVKWGALGTREVLGVLLGMGTKLFANLMARCDNIAVAMAARGFRGPEEHTLHLGPPPVERRQGWQGVGADAAVLGSLGALVALSWALA